jgi:hypothetical protein
MWLTEEMARQQHRTEQGQPLRLRRRHRLGEVTYFQFIILMK